MADSEPINFESSKEKEKYREQLRIAREHALDKAKYEYEKQQRRKEEAAKRGEGTWMLPALSLKITQQEQDLERSKKKKTKKEKKKDKKKKSKKDSKKRSKKSSSDSDSDAGPQWVDKSQIVSSTSDESSKKPVIKGPRIERDNWMMGDDFDGLGGITSKQFKEDRRKEREAAIEAKKPEISEPGQNKMELNPYWKDGGSGMPEEEEEAKPKIKAVPPSISAGDGGVGWWRKAYQRCEEQAKDEGRTMEEVAADRYGSLKKLEKLVHDSEKNQTKGNQQRHDRGYPSSRHQQGERNRGDFRSNYRDNDRMREKGPVKPVSKFMKPKDLDDDEDIPSSRYGSTHRNKPNHSGWKKQGFMKPGEAEDSQSRPDRKFLPPKDTSDDESSGSTRRNQKSRSPVRYHRYHRSRSRSPRKDHRSHSRSKSPKRSRRSRSRSKSPKRNRRSRSRSKSPKHHRSKSKSPVRHQTGWRKSGNEIKSEHIGRRRVSSSHSESSQTEDSSSSSASSESETEAEVQQPSVPAVKILTEGEMNVIGAKILRAELMGDQAQASQLKAQLDASREASKNAPKAAVISPSPSAADEDKEDKDAVLTRTDREGNVRPVETRSAPRESKKGRKKKQKVDTHTKSGTRERYFDDDDKYDLKSLVEREKNSTAEDQDMMFARLAGRKIDKTDDDHQIDDVMVSRAGRQQSQSTIEDRDRDIAVFEHKKINEAMDKCNFCFNKVAKHLIIAIGNKVYLCLPHHRSMVEGHCLIVPMQHVSQGTATDEDVWEEIQTFRKMLTKMFMDQDEDCMFMETSMNLQRLPHLVIECVPMPREVGDLAPIYFKKAITEVGPEWAQNKKLVALSKKDIKHSVPKAFPYFSVDFGLQGGFAHVIEDEKTFQPYFGREIVAGMLDLEVTLWRKPHRENFDQQRSKVLKFAEMWKPYDWTSTINKV